MSCSIKHKIYLIGGLPCSGKTTYANKMTDVVIDDISDLRHLPSPHVSFAITDVNFCLEKTVDRCKKILNIMYPDHEVVEIYFENNIDKCLNNMQYRNDGREVMEAIKLYSRFYNPPENALDIWQLENNEEITNTA